VFIDHKVTARRATWDYFRSRCYAEGLSKAVVSRLVGAKDGLHSEWNYTLNVLPRGFFHGIFNTLRGRERKGYQRSFAILAGLLITATGYLSGTVLQVWKNLEKRARKAALA
jgi:hypothetical protein